MPQRTISDLIVNSLGSLSQAGQERYASVALAEEQGPKTEEREAGAETWEDGGGDHAPGPNRSGPDILPGRGRILGPLTIVTGHHKLSYDLEFRAQGPETAS